MKANWLDYANEYFNIIHQCTHDKGTYAEVKKQEIKHLSQQTLQQKSWIIPSKPAPAAMMGAIKPQTRAVWSDMVKEKSSG